MYVYVYVRIDCGVEWEREREKKERNRAARRWQSAQHPTERDLVDESRRIHLVLSVLAMLAFSRTAERKNEAISSPIDSLIASGHASMQDPDRFIPGII